MNKIIKENSQGLLLVISGPSGCGKGTIIKELLKKKDDLWLSISDTTRLPRENEQDGIDYNFITKNKFQENIKNNEYLEYAIVHSNNYYGTPKKHIFEKNKNSIDVILEIDIEGALQINNKIPSAIFIFIMPPDMKTLKERLIGRKTETKEQVVERFKTAYKEINEVSKYNYVIVNDDIQKAVEKVLAIITCEKCRVDRIEEVYLGNQEEIIHEILVDLEN